MIFDPTGVKAFPVKAGEAGVPFGDPNFLIT